MLSLGERQRTKEMRVERRRASRLPSCLLNCDETELTPDLRELCAISSAKITGTRPCRSGEEKEGRGKIGGVRETGGRQRNLVAGADQGEQVGVERVFVLGKEVSHCVVDTAGKVFDGKLVRLAGLEPGRGLVEVAVQLL